MRLQVLEAKIDGSMQLSLRDLTDEILAFAFGSYNLYIE